MGKSLMLATTALPLLLGLAGIAQAGNGPGIECDTTEFAVVECKSSKRGGFEVFAYSNDGGHAPAIEVGDDCADALNALVNEGDGEGHAFFFFGKGTVVAVSTGTPDKTIYTANAFGGFCPD